MGLEILNGKKFCHKSKYNADCLPSIWIGVVKWTTVIHDCNLDGTYSVKIKVVSEQNSSYDLDELIFLN